MVEVLEESLADGKDMLGRTAVVESCVGVFGSTVALVPVSKPSNSPCMFEADMEFYELLDYEEDYDTLEVEANFVPGVKKK